MRSIRKRCVFASVQRRRRVEWYYQDVERDIVDLYRGESIVWTHDPPEDIREKVIRSSKGMQEQTRA
ncbi:hypothetical protein HBI56_144920 [Parastagonospora nodorum]|jgi:hypothetical protein|uniref:Uncharacterized protein n=1 Tax=Phaeosphaeria nodorum (strain SN15 / ATCC MYA-4574 / FGSC 10173) TaxID=321614 RepID=A0A7U2I1Y6_PHANO|nr:hypothetical protein HBH56_032120 [Parastagonospora nodorum]QRD00351.1 hypothetical protein JI435_415100 [Parastagonospora nodorum SN15]KAH3933593.1 hypothetical protein HBH54_067330 [Parastagonospora nodorum]KAH3952536.1 hypothetical protein HBH53_042720 [Parastagonospora nodorum]KAH3979761.1 hypothetical protein HBH51_053750 [Parastagonospora nodorum]